MPKSDFKADSFLQQFHFHPVIAWPRDYEVYDFSAGYDAARPRRFEYGVGRYNERRVGMYTSKFFAPGSEMARDIHMGLDLAAPAGTPVSAFHSGVVYLQSVRPAAGDYGGTIVTEHQLGERKLWALYGHLNHVSVSLRKIGSAISAGDVLGWLGDATENGGWNPHLHLQLSWERPIDCDMPGVVTQAHLARALEIFPDPRNVVGELY